jgi:2-methylcitrate dehydratase PrpD
MIFSWGDVVATHPKQPEPREDGGRNAEVRCVDVAGCLVAAALQENATAATNVLDQVYQRTDAFLFGRRTYEIFAGYWGAMADFRATPSQRR